MLEELVATLVALNCILTLWIMRMIIQQLNLAVVQIDSLVAQAIQKILENGLGDFEPPNPIQAAISELLLNRVKQGDNILEAQVMPRDSSGKFTKD